MVGDHARPALLAFQRYVGDFALFMSGLFRSFAGSDPVGALLREIDRVVGAPSRN